MEKLKANMRSLLGLLTFEFLKNFFGYISEDKDVLHHYQLTLTKSLYHHKIEIENGFLKNSIWSVYAAFTSLMHWRLIFLGE